MRNCIWVNVHRTGPTLVAARLTIFALFTSSLEKVSLVSRVNRRPGNDQVANPGRNRDSIWGGGFADVGAEGGDVNGQCPTSREERTSKGTLKG